MNSANESQIIVSSILTTIAGMEDLRADCWKKLISFEEKNIMANAKLFVLEMEIELLWTDMEYYREVRVNGRADSEVLGGLITVGFPANESTDKVLEWMTKESHDKTGKELDKMEKGKVCFYADGFDYPPTRTYEFNDAFLTYFSEEFNAESQDPMTTVITISPAIQNYAGEDLVKRWNVSWIEPEEEEPYQPANTAPEKKPTVEDYFLTDSNGSRIEEAKVGDTIFLNVKTKDLIGETLTISLNDKNADFKYKGKVLPNDTISDYKINSDLVKIRLEVIEQQ